ncbi:MAG: hypothetical protein H0W88_04730 [Parachlamydiaceae bacterium]|nr:hypothetical protein [Parachlamydiaceae bacterium]
MSTISMIVINNCDNSEIYEHNQIQGGKFTQVLVENQFGFKQWFSVVTDTLLSFDGFWAAASLFSSVNEVAGMSFKGISENSKKTNEFLDPILESFDCITILDTAKWWVCKKPKSRGELISKTISTILKVHRTAKFLSTKGVINFQKFAIFSKHIPIVGVITNGLAATYKVINLNTIYKEYIELSRDYKVIGQTITKVDSKCENEIRENLNKKRIDINKQKMNLLMAIDTLASSVFTILGICSGGILTLSPAVMGVQGIVSSAVWLYSCYYGEKHK